MIDASRIRFIFTFNDLHLKLVKVWFNSSNSNFKFKLNSKSMLSIISQVSERKHRKTELQRKSGCRSILWHMARLKVILKTYIMSATQLWYRVLVQQVPFTLLGELPLIVRITQVPNVFFWNLIIWCYWDSRAKSSSSISVGQSIFMIQGDISWTGSEYLLSTKSFWRAALQEIQFLIILENNSFWTVFHLKKWKHCEQSPTISTLQLRILKNMKKSGLK